jgi:hypothetical protein
VSRAETWGVRIASAFAVLAAAVGPSFMDVPETIPDYALRASAVLYLERSAAILGVSTIFIMVVFWGVVRGRPPKSAGRDSLQYDEEVSSEQERSIRGLQTQIDALERDVREIAERAVLKRLPPT